MCLSHRNTLDGYAKMLLPILSKEKGKKTELQITQPLTRISLNKKTVLFFKIILERASFRPG